MNETKKNMEASMKRRVVIIVIMFFVLLAITPSAIVETQGNYSFIKSVTQVTAAGKKKDAYVSQTAHLAGELKKPSLEELMKIKVSQHFVEADPKEMRYSERDSVPNNCTLPVPTEDHQGADYINRAIINYDTFILENQSLKKGKMQILLIANE